MKRTESILGSSMPRLLVSAAAFVVVVAGMKAAKSIIVPFLISVFIAIISAPPLFWLRRKRVPGALALLIVFAGILLAALLVSAVVGTSLDGFVKTLPDYQAKLQEQVGNILDALKELGMPVRTELVMKSLNPGAAIQFAATLLKGFGGILTNAFLILMTVVFILLEAGGLPGKIRKAIPEAEESMDRFQQVADNVNRYMVIKTLVSLLTGLAVFIMLWLTGVDFPVLWGLLAFLFNYVPNIGSIIAAVPAVLLAFIAPGGAAPLIAALGYVAINVVVGNILEPKFMGRGLGLSTLVVFLSLVFWGWVFGPVGMLLSVPLTMTVKIALDSNEETRWLAVLMGPEVHVAGDDK